MVDRTVRDVTLPADVKSYYASPEKEEVELIDVARTTWNTSAPQEKKKFGNLVTTSEKPFQLRIATPIPRTAKLVTPRILTKKGSFLQRKVNTAAPEKQIVPVVPVQSTSVECSEKPEKPSQNYQFCVVPAPVNETPTRTTNNSVQHPKNGHIVHVSSAGSNGIESATGVLQRRSLHTIPTLVLTSNGAENGNQVLLLTPAQVVTKEMKISILNPCGQCKKLPEYCECAKNAISSSGVSGTSLSFQRTVASLKQKAKLDNQNRLNKAVITKQSFYGNGINYGHKLKEQMAGLQSPATTRTIFVTSVIPASSIMNKRLKLGPLPEPECLTISSDEDECSKSSDSFDIPELPESNSNSYMEHLANRHERMRDKDGEIISNKRKQTKVSIKKAEEKIECKEKIEPSPNVCRNLSIKFEVNCRSIRIGSYKLQPNDDATLPATFTDKHVCFTIPTVSEHYELVTLVIRYQDIARVLCHFSKALPVLFIYTTPACGSSIRSKLHMLDETTHYYDPTAKDETIKRITILPLGITNEERDLYRKILPKDVMEEIPHAKANEILVRSVPICPPPWDTTRFVGQRTRLQTTKIVVAPSPSRPIVKLLTYPPPPQTGGITITSEDLDCLNPQEFLNDVIIDFYLKYLVMEKLNNEEREQIHVFSSFFYPRLTQKPTVRNTTEDSTHATSQQKRHARVKTWTRHLDIFKKDFIIVPINQSAHWFLAIICFPGHVPEEKSDSEPKTPADNKNVKSTDEPASSVSSPDFSENSTSSPHDEVMDVDSATKVCEDHNCSQNGTESPFQASQTSLVPYDSDSSDDVGSNAVEEPPVSTDKAASNCPCILIFDSLPGPSRWRIVATLREYLEVEWAVKKGTKRIFDRESMRGVNVKVPVQTNFSDCGVFLLQYVETFFERLSGCVKLELWFSEQLINEKRDQIKELITSLQQQQCSTANDSIVSSPKNENNSSLSYGTISTNNNKENEETS